MTSPHHCPDAEEIMAYLDGELDAPTADSVGRHIEACAVCADVAAGLRETSARLKDWDVGAAPAFGSKVRDIRSARGWWRRMPAHYAAMAAAAVLVVAAAVGSLPRLASPAVEQVDVLSRGGEAAMAASPPPPAYVDRLQPTGAMEARAVAQVPEASSGPLLVRTARLMLSAVDFESARNRFEALVTEAGGFMGHVTLSGAPRDRRSLSATVRVPSAQFDKTVAALRTIGVVTSESQDGEDVTRQSVDLDARLSNARASEARLKTILEQRTGRLSDVLDVEREISRVRGEIERMEAERKSLDGRIQFASIEVTILEEEKASLDLGTQPLSARFRNAFVDGWSTAVGGVVEAGLVLTGLLPTVFVLTLIAVPAIVIYRWRVRA